MSDFVAASPDSYRYWAAEHVRFADLDRLGHVNNKAYATYVESARVDFLTACGLERSAKIGMALVRLEIDYLREIRFPATLRLGVSLRRLGTSSITLACGIFEGDICASTSLGISVCFDAEVRKSKPFSESEREALKAYL